MRLVESGRRRIRDRRDPERTAQANLARALVAQRRYILLFSHMRSYSTLIGHLVGSHPQISGYTEQHQSYRSFADLSGLCYGVWKVSDYEVTGDYLFDKVLQDTLSISDEVLLREDVLPVYAIREPIASMRSVVAMGRRKNRPSWNEPERAIGHFSKRYAALRELSERRPDSAALFADSIITSPEQTLTELSTYLGLDSAITPAYDLFPKTGVSGFGDPTGPIEAGRIVADRPAHAVDIPDDVAARLVADYERTCEVLVSRCRTVLGEPVTSARR